MEILETQERKMNKKQRKEERNYTLFRTLPSLCQGCFRISTKYPTNEVLAPCRGVMKALCGSLFLYSLLSVYNVDTSRQILELAVDTDTVQCIYAVLLCSCLGSSRLDTTGTFTDYNPIGQHVSF